MPYVHRTQIVTSVLLIRCLNVTKILVNRRQLLCMRFVCICSIFFVSSTYKRPYTLRLIKKMCQYICDHNSGKTDSIFGRPYYRSSLWYSGSSVCLSVCLSVVCDVLYCGKTVRPSKKLSEGVNRKPGSKSSFLRSPPYFYFRFRHYGHQDGRFCLIFARIAQQSVVDGRN